MNTFNVSKTIIEKNEILNNEMVNNEIIKNENDVVVRKKKLIEMVNNLTNIEYKEILNIIQEDNCNYSSNNNGVFINLSNVGNNTIDKIFNFLKFTKLKKEELKEKEIYLDSFKNNIKNKENSKTILEKNDDDNQSVNSLSSKEEVSSYNDYLCFSSDDEN